MKGNRMRKWPALMLTAAMLVTAVPAQAVYAGQQNSYHDPLKEWVVTDGRTNELDVNSVVTSETSYCVTCGVNTEFRAYRVPEYTKDGTSAADQDILYSDGTKSNGKDRGSVRSGKVYTGYHWTKSLCTKCGSVNSNYTDKEGYAYGRDVYILYDCSEKFMKPLDTTFQYEYMGSDTHRVIRTDGSYCGICYGTVKKDTSTVQPHNYSRKVTAEPANHRFQVTETCDQCGYSKTQYIAAKSAVADYHGKADGKPHSVSVTPLSDEGVDVSILYGSEADKCTEENAPSYKKAGDYKVYYAITYSYKNVSMTENGVAWVDLNGKTSAGNGTGTDNTNTYTYTDITTCKCGDPDCCCGDECDGTNCDSTCDIHRYKLLEKVDASCEAGGCDRYICTGCGKIVEKNRTDRLGHQWKRSVIRESSCVEEGKTLKICERCGKADVETEPEGAHKYVTRTVEATCTMPGHTLTECTVCGDKVVNDITAALPHNYVAYRTDPGCLTGGHTLHRCEGCGSSFITDYTKALGHDFDDGRRVTDATCTGKGVTEFTCERCGYRKIEGTDATGHEPGEEATCDSPQICVKCGAVIKKALGHDYEPEKVEPTDTEPGYTIYKCARCGDSYRTDYVFPKKDKDKSGRNSVPADDEKTNRVVKTHAAYMYGYPDATFRPDGDMTRAEAAAVFARLLADSRGETPERTGNSYVRLFTDVPSDYWAAGNINYLASFGILSGTPDGAFYPDESITRSELTAMAVNFYDVYASEKSDVSAGQAAGFSDVDRSDWASGYISQARGRGWIRGYGDGTFRGLNPITRGEMISITNNLLNRAPDSGYIQANTRSMVRFSDLGENHWAYYPIMEAANGHRSELSGEGENWIRING